MLFDLWVRAQVWNKQTRPLGPFRVHSGTSPDVSIQRFNIQRHYFRIHLRFNAFFSFYIFMETLIIGAEQTNH